MTLLIVSMFFISFLFTVHFDGDMLFGKLILSNSNIIITYLLITPISIRWRIILPFPLNIRVHSTAAVRAITELSPTQYLKTG
ncbi:Os11g0573900 [Oryza sativa Japonica Group]|uniref:Os11g0573900 protein n=2 Tax=Oryza sativa subsp. japonica TaxID=39947 RepID=Q0IS20_ORYSJ|nr:hypothetical protein EE612_056267 [Oryza sativa]BAF28495.1 Os11g0573900 [Oryza sativa Japonica Group]BAT14551.1 Os11g0573900 [Oryza sativa Japonica Group]|eukprot:NP_001068132.1 Os11g0573900 [Oryza sativa Japonica Group]